MIGRCCRHHFQCLHTQQKQCWTLLIRLSHFVTAMTATLFTSTTMPTTCSKLAPPMSPLRKGCKRALSTVSTHSITKVKKKSKGRKGNKSNGSDEEAIDKEVKRKWGKQPQ